MTQTHKPDALLLVSTHCPHCHRLETLLREREEKGELGNLDTINIEQSPDTAQQYNVRSVPWLRLGPFVFDEALASAELDRWIREVKQGRGQSRYIAYLLGRGRLNQAIEWLENGHGSLDAVIRIIADADAKINVRVGVGAILEHFENTDVIRAIISDLVLLLHDRNPTIRTDAAHYLSLTHSREVIASLKAMLEDENEEVRQVAAESIEALNQD